MEKRISIPYYIASRNSACVVSVIYTIERELNSVLINCSVQADDNNNNNWLSLRKFELKSLNENGCFNLIFNDRNNVRALDTTLFIDQVYTMIMEKEKLPLLQVNTSVANIY